MAMTVEGFTSSASYDDGDIILINGEEFVINKVKKKEVTLDELEKRVKTLEDFVNKIPDLLLLQQNINSLLSRSCGPYSEAIQSNWDQLHF